MPPKNQPTRSSAPPPSQAPEIVDPKWLLQAGAAAVAAALVFAYIATCWLFYKAQWQLVLKPSHTESHQPGEYGLTATPVSFGSASSVHGWLIPGASRSAPWVLMLPSGDGSAGDSLPRAHTFHELGLQVLLFDYRGFGSSLGQHPTEALMEQDSEDALDFLKGQPGFAPGQLIVYGTGAGASLATRLGTQHPEMAAIILEQADGDFASRARLDPRAKPVPFGILFNQNFPLADPLHALVKPKLLISYTTGPAPEAIKRAADPKMLLEVPSATDPGLPNGIRRFLDMYVQRPSDTLLPGAP